MPVEARSVLLVEMLCWYEALCVALAALITDDGVQSVAPFYITSSVPLLDYWVVVFSLLAVVILALVASSMIVTKFCNSE